MKDFQTLLEAKEMAKTDKAKALLHRPTKFKSSVQVKEAFNEKRDKLARGHFTRTLVKAHIKVEHCAKCHSVTECVDRFEIWAKSTAPGTDLHKITNHVITNGMYELNEDLPLSLQKHKVYVARCVDCLYADAERRKPE